MKKLFLRTGLFAGLAMSTIALASCGGSNEVQLQDADGNTYKVAVTEDSDTVSKAMVLAAANATKGEEKQYAFSVDASVDAKITLEMEGIKGTVTAGAKAFVGASIGKDAYKAYEMGEEGYAEADFTEATAALKKGLGFLATAEGNVKFSDLAVNEKAEVWTDASAEALAETKARVAGYNGKGANAKVRAFLNDGTFYAEVEAKAAKELTDTEEDSEYNYYGKAALPLDEMSPMMATALHDFQTKSYSEFLEAYLPMLSDMGLPVELPEELPTFEVNKAFFESDDYETLTKIVKALGVKISAINGSNVTFAVDITGNEVKEAVKAVNPALVLMLPADLSTDKTILSVSVTMNAVKGLVSQVKVSTEAVDVIASVAYQVAEMVISNMFGNQVKAMVNHLAVEKSETPWDSLSGTFKFEANFKYDADVKVAATPNSAYTYVEMND